jgi:hypothetical protein
VIIRRVVGVHVRNVVIGGHAVGPLAIPAADSRQFCLGVAYEACQMARLGEPTSPHCTDPHAIRHRQCSSPRSIKPIRAAKTQSKSSTTSRKGGPTAVSQHTRDSLSFRRDQRKTRMPGEPIAAVEYPSGR